MKREDLYRERREHRSVVHSRQSQEISGRYPLCHFFQMAAAVLALLCIAGSRFLFPEAASKELKSQVKMQLESQIHLNQDSWGGSLKELFTWKK